MHDAGAKTGLIERIAAKLELSPGEHNRIQNKVIKKVAPPMITIGFNRSAVKDSRGCGLAEKSERTKKKLSEIMAKRPQIVADKCGISREDLIKKLEEKCRITRRKKEELSEQELFRQNVASVAAKMNPTTTYLDPNGLTPKPYVKGNSQAAKTLKNMNKPSTENPTTKFTPALDGSVLPVVKMSDFASPKLGKKSYPVDGKNTMDGAGQFEFGSLKAPKKGGQSFGSDAGQMT